MSIHFALGAEITRCLLFAWAMWFLLAFLPFSLCTFPSSIRRRKLDLFRTPSFGAPKLVIWSVMLPKYKNICFRLEIGYGFFVFSIIIKTSFLLDSKFIVQRLYLFVMVELKNLDFFLVTALLVLMLSFKFIIFNFQIFVFILHSCKY